MLLDSISTPSFGQGTAKRHHRDDGDGARRGDGRKISLGELQGAKD